MTYLLIFLASCASTAVLTGAVRRYALRAQVLDLPNARSLHAAPTPRGGGLGVVPVVLLVQLAAAIWCWWRAVWPMWAGVTIASR